MNLLTPNGWKDINDVNVGDDLVAYDVNTGQEILNQLLSKQLLTVQEEEATFYRINGTWTLYKNQSVWVDGRVDHAFNLKSGDTVYNGTDGDVAITTVEEVTGTEWWRLEVSGDHSYIADDLTLHNASRYWVGGGSSTNWDATANTNWGSASGVQDNSSVPTSADDVFFDSNSTTTCTVTSAANAKSFSSTKASLVITLDGGDLTVLGDTVINVNGATINSSTGNILYAKGGLNILRSLSGTAKIIIQGGIWRGLSTSSLNNDLDIQGDITISGDLCYGTGTLKYVSGTVTTTGSRLFITNTCTLNTNGITWNNITARFNITLTSDLLINGLMGVDSNSISSTGQKITINGGLTLGRSLSGTSKIVLTGGTWSGVFGLSNDLDIQGSCTISGNVYYSTNTITYISGTVTTTGSTLNLTGACTLNTNGMSWNNITLANSLSITYTINSLLSISGTLNLGTSGGTVFAGTSGWSCGTLSYPNTGGSSITLKDGNTYTVNTLFECYQTRVGSIVLFTSSHASNRAILTLRNPSACNCLASFTRIDASQGRTITAFMGTVTDCLNVISYNDMRPVAA